MIAISPAAARSGPARKHFPALDGIRALAALLVMWFHFFQNRYVELGGALRTSVHHTLSAGQTGVDLFFVLSGFLITRILLQARDQPGYFRNFYVKRVLRIFPLYYFFLICFLYLLPLANGSRVATFAQSWWWWVYLQNIPMTFHHWTVFGPDHYWSLAVEEHFYLVWPFLVWWFGRRHLLAISAALIAVSFLIRVELNKAGIGDFYFTPTRLDALSFGAILALIEPICFARPKAFRIGFVTGIVLVGAPLVLFYPQLAASHSFWVNTLKFPLTALVYFCGLGLAILLNPTALLQRLLSSGVLTALGRISYGLYVYHLVCFGFAERIVRIPNPLLAVPFGFGLTILVASLSYRWLETPFLRLKPRFAGSGA